MTEIIDAPAVAPRKFGLYSVADKQNGTPHEMYGGVEYFSDNCNMAVTATTDSVCVGTPTRTVTQDGHSTITRLAFPIYVYTECAGINEFKDAQSRAVAILNLGEERAVEAKLNALLAAEVTTDSTAVVGGSSPKRALAALEEIMDQNYGGQPTFGGSRSIVSLLADSGSVDIHGNHLETGIGSLIFGSSAFDLGPSTNTPAAGKNWLWGMGKTRVFLGKSFVSEPVFIQNAGANEVQTVAITGTPTGGSLTLTFNGQTTAAIAYNANAGAVQSALEALSNVEPGDIVVTGTNPSFTLTFAQQYAKVNVPQITAAASLTGGSTPGVTTGTTTTGVLPATDNSYRTMATRQVIVDYDCFAAAALVTLDS